MDDWSFGGGTGLMLQIGHRESHDVDLFVSDAQYLPFLNPEMQDFDLAIRPSDYELDGSHMLKIVFEMIGEIDFICCLPVTSEPWALTEVRGRLVRLETPAEIIAKKIYFRGGRMQPRDMFDIAATVQASGEDYVVAALSPFGAACRSALNVAERMDPAFARTIMSSLLAHDMFSSLHEEAQVITCRVLKRAATKET